MKTYVVISLLVVVAGSQEIYSNGYNRTAMQEMYPGFGTEWIWFPDENENPQVVYLKPQPGRDIPETKQLTGAEISENVFFWLYTRQSPSKTVISMSEDSLKSSSFDPSKPTKLVTHGYFSSGDADTCQSIKNEFLKKYDANIFIMDWGNLSGGFYPITAGYPERIGQYTGSFVNFLVSSGVDPKNMHIVGHSLGAHLAGFTGREAAKNGNKIARITGLDPAGVLFSASSPTERLDASDAEFVDVIHTCGAALGMYSAIGDVDFYPNSGVPAQPGCFSIIKMIESCSHGRSWKFFAESINAETQFMAYKCNSWTDFFEKHECTGNVIPMGEPVPDSARGVYYLRTNDESPFAIGFDSNFDQSNMI